MPTIEPTAWTQIQTFIYFAPNIPGAPGPRAPRSPGQSANPYSEGVDTFNIPRTAYTVTMVPLPSLCSRVHFVQCPGVIGADSIEPFDHVRCPRS